MSDAYCYKNSDVLINLLNIRDNQKLYDAEVEYTTGRCAQLENEPITGNFDFKHLKAIHKYIFQDIYSWAGQPRNGDIAKGNTLFCLSQNIDSYAAEVFSKFASDCFFYKSHPDMFAEKLADHYADLNCLHPFREGNGRTQREFARELCLVCDYVFDLNCATQKDMVLASRLAYAGNTKPLAKIFEQALTPVGDYQKKHNNLQILCKDEPIKFHM